jgi:hypothetical protein
MNRRGFIATSLGAVAATTARPTRATEPDSVPQTKSSRSEYLALWRQGALTHNEVRQLLENFPDQPDEGPGGFLIGP